MPVALEEPCSLSSLMAEKGLLEKKGIAAAVNNKIVQGISDIRDESDRKGMRIVFELKKAANVEVVKNQLFQHTRLQTSFGSIMIALENNQPKTFNIKQMLVSFLTHRQIVVRKRTAYDLKKAEERARD